MSDGTELEGLADAPDTTTDTVRQDLHLSLCLLRSSQSQSRPAANLPILQLTPGRIIDPNFLKREEMMQLFAQRKMYEK